MNRRNFFSLAVLSAVAMVVNKAAAFLKPPAELSLEECFQRDLNAWAQKYQLSAADKRQGAMLGGHCHSIHDPGHSHSLNPPMHYVHYTARLK